MELFLIDAIGPFFRGVEGRRINWSKIPFGSLPLGRGQADERERVFRQVRDDLGEFCRRVAQAGFNAVTLDDVSHLARCPAYEDEAGAIIEACRAEFRKLFAIVREAGLRIHVTMDVMTFTPALRSRVGTGAGEVSAFLGDHLDRFLADFPEVDGVVMRIGECDGRDVGGIFRSELVIRDARGLNRLLREVLPVFECRRRQLVLRTWTVGAYRIGDLIWHRGTFQRALEGIASPNFILSMKHGESDFFRYLPLNRNFFRTGHRKILELQARREYEGCGEFPSYVGIDHEHWARELATAPNMVGISVWCQTGGWVPFRRLAFIDRGSVWTELNAKVTLRIFRDGVSHEAAVKAELGEPRSGPALELLRLSDEAVKHLLYVEEFARQKLFFRRVRIPPQLAVYWNNVFINPSVRRVLRHFVRDREAAIRQGKAALAKVARMRELAESAGLPVDDIEFMFDTFAILALAREYHFGENDGDGELAAAIRRAKAEYQARYPRSMRPRYRIDVDLRPFPLRGRSLALLARLLLRRRRGYRLIDRLLVLHVLGWVYRLASEADPGVVPGFARESAMGVDAVFR